MPGVPNLVKALVQAPSKKGSRVASVTPAGVADEDELTAVVGHAALDSDGVLPKSVGEIVGNATGVHLDRATGSTNVRSSFASSVIFDETELAVSVCSPGFKRMGVPRETVVPSTIRVGEAPKGRLQELPGKQVPVGSTSVSLAQFSVSVGLITMSSRLLAIWSLVVGEQATNMSEEAIPPKQIRPNADSFTRPPKG